MHLTKPTFRRFAWLAVLAVLLQLGLSAGGVFARGTDKGIPWADDLCLSAFTPQDVAGGEASLPTRSQAAHCPLCAVSTPPRLADYLAVFLFGLTLTPVRVEPAAPLVPVREPVLARLAAPRAPPVLQLTA
ncbi:hypothetical protein [Niveibacterium sp. SC-1]|uniref:hypothetical protein n=1 Tax=Niveibacterium sp. SC-1 TaxID=3135646 RepID=UPI00311E5516